MKHTKKVKRIVSFGAGLNSVAMLALLRIKKVKIDEVLFADTGVEEPETYNWIESQAKPYLKEQGIKFTTVQSHLGNMYDYYYSYKVIPFQSIRECTDKFKIRPIKKYIEEYYSNELVFCYIGYDADEPQRIKIKKGMRKHFMPYVPVYPLLEYEITRKRCKTLSQLIRLYPPTKSRCFFCPFRKEAGFIELLKHHPDLFQKAEDLERNCRTYPRQNLLNNPKNSLRCIRKKYLEQQRLIPPIMIEYKK